VGVIAFTADDGTSFVPAASILAEVDGTPGANDMPGRLIFSTTPSASAAPVERMRIDSQGRVGIGTTSPADYRDDAEQLVLANTSGNCGVTVASATTGTGALYFADGTTSTTNRRGFILYTHSGDTLDFGTSGATRARINNSGRILVNTTTSRNVGPQSEPLLQVEGTQFASGISLVQNSSNGSDPARIVLAKSKSFGVGGVTSVSANNQLGGIYFAGADGSTMNATAASIVGIVDGISASNSVPGCLQFSTTPASSFPTERLRIDSSGRLLVGTSSARANFFNSTLTTKFQIEGNGTDSWASIIADDNSTSSPILVLGKQRSGTVGGNTIVQSGDEVGRLSFQGNDGTDFVETATISTFVDGTPGANDMPGRLVFSTTADGASSPTERMRITNSGKLYVNTTDTTTQTALLNLQNSDDDEWLISCCKTNKKNVIQFLAGSPSAEVGKITVSTTGTSYSTSSDYRLKENVVPLTGATDRLKLIPVHRFNFVSDPDTTVDGFLAHEAQAVVPECVTGTKDEVDEDGNPVYQGIDQSKLVPLLTAALQEALAEIESLKARVTALEP
jgi:hypothetical protein